MFDIPLDVPCRSIKAVLLNDLEDPADFNNAERPGSASIKYYDKYNTFIHKYRKLVG